MELRSSRYASVGLLFFLASTARAAPMFVPLGDLAGGNFDSNALEVSADGSTVVGWSASAGGVQEAFRWTAETGMVGLGNAVSSAEGVSADGSVVAGWGFDSPVGGQPDQAFRWSSATGMVGLGSLGGGEHESDARGISADGSTIVGGSFRDGLPSDPYYEAFRWTSASGMVGLGTLPLGLASWGTAASADGSVVVGASEVGGTSQAAFRWTEGTGMVDLGSLSPSLSYSSAQDVSDDGSTVVGWSRIPFMDEFWFTRAFRWTAETGMVDLDVSPDNGEAFAVSGDGSVVVGTGGGVAFLWDETHGVRSLQDLLADLGVDTSGWALGAATGISADGRVIVGTGRNPNGQREAWLAIIPEPGTFALLAAGLALLGGRRLAA